MECDGYRRHNTREYLSLLWHPPIRPIFGVLDQPSANRILKNIFGLVIKIFLISQTMIEEVLLPNNFMVNRLPPLPIAYDFGKRRDIRKTQEEMRMVSH